MPPPLLPQESFPPLGGARCLLPLGRSVAPFDARPSASFSGSFPGRGVCVSRHCQRHQSPPNRLVLCRVGGGSGREGRSSHCSCAPPVFPAGRVGATCRAGLGTLQQTTWVASSAQCLPGHHLQVPRQAASCPGHGSRHEFWGSWQHLQAQTLGCIRRASSLLYFLGNKPLSFSAEGSFSCGAHTIPPSPSRQGSFWVGPLRKCASCCCCCQSNPQGQRAVHNTPAPSCLPDFY